MALTCVVVLATVAAELATNVASSAEDWPLWLRPVRSHPWVALAVLAVVVAVLAGLLSLLTEKESRVRDSMAAGSDSAPNSGLVLRSLPRDTSGFTNRSAEIDRLLAAVRAGNSAPLHVIDGMPGVGKTAFAVHVGHLLADRFPDGQIFLNLNGYTVGRRPISSADALASLLAADGMTAQQIPTGEDPGAVIEVRAALWRSRLAGRRVLLILDNAVSYQQVEPLLPGDPRCLVLVTSRRRLGAVDGALATMEGLSPRDATGLLLALSGRDIEPDAPSAAEDVVALCGHLPLAIALLAAQLRRHPAWTVASLRTRLSAPSGRRLGELRSGETAVSTVFDLSYRELPADLRLAFRRLGFFPGTELDAYTAAAVAGLSVENARTALEGLFDAHLVDEVGPDRYRMHDLLRDYARVLTQSNPQAQSSPEARRGDPEARSDPEAERSAAMNRVQEYYLRTITHANRLVARTGTGTPPPPTGDGPPFPSRAEALAWLRNERPNVLACIAQADEHGAPTVVFRLAAAMAPYLRQAGPWDQTADLHSLAARAAQAPGDRAAEAAALREVGVVRRMMARYPEAVTALEAAAALYREIEDWGGSSTALNQVGIVHYLRADYEQAEDAQRQALDCARRTPDRLAQANALADLGMVLRQTGHYPQAEDAQTEALTIYSALGDRYGEANALRDLGIITALRGDYPTAARLHARAHRHYVALDDPVHQAYALNEIGTVQRLSNQNTDARESHQAALRLYSDLGDRFGQANSLRLLGVLDRLAADAESSRTKLRDALEIYQSLGSRIGQAQTLNELGALDAATGDLGAADDHFQVALGLFRDLQDPNGEAEVLINRGRLRLRTGRITEAGAEFAAALVIAGRIGSAAQEADALAGSGRCALATGDPDAARDLLQAARDAYRRLGATTAAQEIQADLRSLT